MPIEVSKHLLAALQPSVHKEDDGNGFIPQLRSVLQRLQNRGAPVLPVIDNEFAIHRDRQRSHSEMRRPLSPNRFELHVAVDRDRDSREGVVLRVLNYIASDLRNPCFVQRPLRPQLWNKLVIVEYEQPPQEAQRTHRDVILSPRLYPANGRKGVRIGIYHSTWSLACLYANEQTYVHVAAAPSSKSAAAGMKKNSAIYHPAERQSQLLRQHGRVPTPSIFGVR